MGETQVHMSRVSPLNLGVRVYDFGKPVTRQSRIIHTRAKIM